MRILIICCQNYVYGGFSRGLDNYRKSIRVGERKKERKKEREREREGTTETYNKAIYAKGFSTDKQTKILKYGDACT